MIYILVATMTFLGAFLKRKDIVYKTSLLLMFILTALRNINLGGTDAYYYRAFFQLCPDIFHLKGYTASYQIGYVLLNAIVKIFTDNYLGFQFVYACLAICLLALVIHQLKLSDFQKCMFLFSYFCFRFIWNNWVTLRQNISILIIWLTMLAIFEDDNKKHKFFWGVLGYGVACTFHTSAVVVFPFFILIWFMGKISNKLKMVGIPIVAFLVYFMGGSIFEILLQFMSEYVDSRYKGYLAIESGDSNFINFIFRMIFYILFCYNYDRIQYKNKGAILNIFAVMILVGSINAGLMMRMYEYFAIGLYTSMAFFIEGFQMTNRKMVSYVYWLSMLVILIRFLLITDSARYFMYSTWWN